MNILKLYWYGILNALIFLSIVVYYFVSVSSLSGTIEKKSNSLTRSSKSLAAMQSAKPTDEWTKQTQERLDKISNQIKDIKGRQSRSDLVLEQFIDIENPTVLSTHPPTANDYPRYKESFKSYWDQFKDDYSLIVEKGEQPDLEVEAKDKMPFKCSRALMNNLEPSWLNNPVRLTEEMIREAQKSYWVYYHTFKILENAKIIQLNSIAIGSAQNDDLSLNNNIAVRKYFDIKVDFAIGKDQVRDVFEAVRLSPIEISLVSMHQKNINSAPRGVESNALFITFEENPKVSIALTLRIFDYEYKVAAPVEGEGI